MSKQIKEMARQIIQDIGGSGNVVSVTHCMTRLRFNLKDMSIPQDETRLLLGKQLMRFMMRWLLLVI